MIRFIPDTWRDAIMRPIAMAAPDAGVYVEIMAPDFRYVFILALLAVWLVLALKRYRPRQPTLILLTFVALAFVPWLATSGNGRYFIAVLLVSGPLCLALIHPLPFTKSLRVAMAVFVLGVQAYLIHESSPWQWWGLAKWNDAPFFETDSASKLTSDTATYVTISSISYSLLIPRFPESSRWINLTSQKGESSQTADAVRTRKFLAAAQTLKVVFPSMPDQMKPGQLPGDELVEAINGLLVGYRLKVSDPNRCGFLRSGGLASVASRRVEQKSALAVDEIGFWVCPLTRPIAVAAPSTPVAPNPVDKVFEKLERACPRVFIAGEASSLSIPDGALRSYISSDMKAYVLNDGTVLYKYLRALNAVVIGTAQDVLADRARINCDKIKGRSGLPWEREI